MPITDSYERLPLSRITVFRDDRQRRQFDKDEMKALTDSIRQVGLINPIIVRNEEDKTVLVAGERRLEAFKQLDLNDIPVRWADQLSEVEASIIELEENIKREDLEWRDRCRAVVKVHELHKQLDPEWNQSKTAHALSITSALVSYYIKIYPELDQPILMKAQTVGQALNIIDTRDRRRAQAVFETQLRIPSPTPMVNGDSVGQWPGEPASQAPEEEGGPVEKVARRADWDIHNLNFLEWAPRYDGPRFNLIHCDFPYGLTEVGPQMQGSEAELYEDSPEIYQALVECLCDNIDRLLAATGQIMFWYSERLGPWTRDMFAHRIPDLEFQLHPLIWLHTDGAGISPDARRRPRHIYDTCMFGSRGDPFLIQVVADAYGAPTDRSLHPSTKPVPMLKHFFSMVTDQYTSLLDPTCGSGAALRAAEALGAGRVMGLEMNPEYCNIARRALQGDRDMRIIAEGIL